MRRLVGVGILLVALIGAYVVLDLVTKSFVEGRVEDEFADTPRLQVDDASFAIDSFPFLVELVAFGEVSATLELEGVQEQGVTIDRFSLDVDGLVFDRTSAFNGDVEATDLDQATAALDLSEGTLSDLAGLPVDITGGAVTAGGVTIRATMVGEDLVLEGEGFTTVTVPLDLGRYLPCSPETEVLEGQVHLSCVTDELPPIVNRVIGEAIDRG